MIIKIFYNYYYFFFIQISIIPQSFLPLPEVLAVSWSSAGVGGHGGVLASGGDDRGSLPPAPPRPSHGRHEVIHPKKSE